MGNVSPLHRQPSPAVARWASRSVPARLWHVRPEPSPAAVRWASHSVPAHLSARGLAVPVWAALLLPAAALLRLLSPWASLILAPAFALAAAVRLAALAVPPPPGPPPLPEADLPTVTALVPLFREEALLPDLAAALGRLDYPARLLEVLILVEESDPQTAAAARAHRPPCSGWQVVVVPEGSPQTKPRACNVGLALAQGEVVVVFDGEDRPDPGQARLAAAALASDPGLAVVQARLGCDHAGPGSPLVARLWALEYAGLFGCVLPALARLGLPFPLGGTSNWFRTDALRAAGGWDAHNVTEDADLGVRLARLGWRSGVIDSTTWEEAPVTARAWLCQRARWLKGFAVTSIVHAREPRRAARELGLPATLALVAQLPASLLCIAAHPLGLALLAGGQVGGALAALMLLGYASALALAARAARRAGLPLWLALLLPAYWLALWAALLLALRDLARDPAHWRKTAHGAVERPGLPSICGSSRAPGRIPCPEGRESPMFSLCSHDPAEERR
ncbi:glycosyltransferase family 2 protein [Sinirhodobacter huangdaonensis]|uniref:Glycosyltransferase n=2 Tax=Paenirhodobacter huangdaonensis TaxID=2501515 RepID=A0A3S3LLU2_9RHOB|nr:glycosyltransferase [Sinirhodobacter huangdaonensis]RWR51568.1 glycosyltransferase [Sinirhodobacter huangdaonensis]